MKSSTQAWFNTLLTSFWILAQFCFTDQSEKKNKKTRWFYSETFDLETQSGWASLPCFLLILYPCFLIYFSEAPLTLPRCVSVSLTENVVRMCQEEWRRGRKRTRGKNKRQSVIMTSVCFTFKRIYNLTHFNFNCRGCRHNMAAIQQQHSQKVRSSNTSSSAFLHLLLCFACFPWWHLTYNISRWASL